MTNEFNFSLAVMCGQTIPMIGSFLSSSAMSSGVILLRTDTTVNTLSISSIPTSLTIDYTAQLIESASFQVISNFGGI